MSYRTKTCAYCNGTHAILDCTKLVSDAKRAKELLELTDRDPSTYIARLKNGLVKQHFYSRQTNSVDKSTGRFSYEPFSSASIEDRNSWIRDVESQLKYDTRNLTMTEPDWLSVSEEDFSNVPTDIQYDDRYATRREVRSLSISNAYAIIRRNDEVQKKVKARATKSCSYCRQTGHTVRTCSQKNQDTQTHYNAYKIAAFLQARALSRFGVWTSSMIKDDGVLFSFNGTSHREPFFFTDIKGNEHISTEDLTDVLYVTAVLDRTRFRKNNSTGYYGDTKHMGFELSKDYLKYFNLENNSIHLDQGDHCSVPDAFYPARISTEHIFNRIMQRYVEPKPKKERYGSERISKASAQDFFDGGYIWLTPSDLFDRKKREPTTFGYMEAFVESNKMALKKAEEILNKS